MLNWISYKLFRLNKFEEKLCIYNGYRKYSICKWKRQTDLSWRLIKKMLGELNIITSRQIRGMLRDAVAENQTIFDDPNCYICKFGKPGKSGEIILYEFAHGCSKFKSKIIEQWKLPRLPENSTIIFLDDLVGSGTQSSEYITDTLNLFLNPSHKPYLLTLCGTPQGLSHVQDTTNFKTMCELILSERDFQHYSTNSTAFNGDEKEFLIKTNGLLSSPGDEEYDKGLLIAFYFTVPNNTMPIIWKDQYPYVDKNGQAKHWFALLPRRYE